MSNVVFEGFNMNKVFTDIMNADDLNGDEKIILLAMSFYQQGSIEGNPAMRMSVDEISGLINRSKGTVVRIMKRLIEKEYIESIRKGQGYPNIYVFKGWRKWQ